METMTRATASRLLCVADAGELLAFKETKGYKLWAFENGIVKRMGKQEFGWHPEMGAAVFALDNKLPLVVPTSHPEIKIGVRLQAIWYCINRDAAIAAYKEKRA